MYKGTINKDTSVQADTNIPFQTTWNTNCNTTPDTNNNQVIINNTGFYDIEAVLQVTDAGATPIIANILANGNVIASGTTDITTSTGTQTITIVDTIRVAVAPQTQKANVSVQINTTGTILPNSRLIIMKVR